MKTSQQSLAVWQKILLFGTGSITLIFCLILYGIWRTGDRVLGFVEDLVRPQPVTPSVEIPTLIVEKIRGIEELTTTVYTMETIVPTSAERKLGELPIATTKLLYIARGEVRAGIDLSQLTKENVKISDRTINIKLPAPQILDSKLDLNYSRVYDYDRGFLNLGPDVAPQLQTLAQRKTLAEIINSACSRGILKTANQRAKATISQLPIVTGDLQLTITTTSPSPQSCQEQVLD